MDPVTAILAALAAGASAAAEGTAKKLIDDAYEGLKSVLKRRFGSRPEATTALEQYEKQPEVWKAPLQAALQASGVERDADVLAALKQLADALGASGAGSKSSVQFHGTAQGVVVGDHNRVDQTFGAPPRGEG